MQTASRPRIFSNNAEEIRRISLREKYAKQTLAKKAASELQIKAALAQRPNAMDSIIIEFKKAEHEEKVRSTIEKMKALEHKTSVKLFNSMMDWALKQGEKVCLKKTWATAKEDVVSVKVMMPKIEKLLGRDPLAILSCKKGRSKEEIITSIFSELAEAYNQL